MASKYSYNNFKTLFIVNQDRREKWQRFTRMHPVPYKKTNVNFAWLDADAFSRVIAAREQKIDETVADVEVIIVTTLQTIHTQTRKKQKQHSVNKQNQLF